MQKQFTIYILFLGSYALKAAMSNFWSPSVFSSHNNLLIKLNLTQNIVCGFYCCTVYFDNNKILFKTASLRSLQGCVPEVPPRLRPWGPFKTASLRSLQDRVPEVPSRLRPWGPFKAASLRSLQPRNRADSQHVTDFFYCCTVHFDNIKILSTNKCTLSLNT